MNSKLSKIHKHLLNPAKTAVCLKGMKSLIVLYYDKIPFSSIKETLSLLNSLDCNKFGNEVVEMYQNILEGETEKGGNTEEIIEFEMKLKFIGELQTADSFKVKQ